MCSGRFRALAIVSAVLALIAGAANAQPAPQRQYQVAVRLAAQNELGATSATRVFAVAIFNNPASPNDKGVCTAIVSYYQNVLPTGLKARPVLFLKNNKYVGDLDCQKLDKIYDAYDVGHLIDSIDGGAPSGTGPFILIVEQTSDGGAWNYGVLDFSKYGSANSTLRAFTTYYEDSTRWFCKHDIMALPLPWDLLRPKSCR